MEIQKKILTYEERLLIPIKGNSELLFFTNPSLELVATGYNRVVIGGRGPYIEFEFDQLEQTILHMPKGSEWRVDSNLAYYIELRTLKDNVKVYWQKRTVNYADYLINKFYISPFDLQASNYPVLVRPLKS